MNDDVTCEECEKEVAKKEDLQDGMCDECYEFNYCECGNKLEDEYGTPGDGLCRACD